MSNVKEVKGCGKYWRLMWQASQATDGSQVRYFARQALQHRETCEECLHLNTPLVNQLFGNNVRVAE